MVLPSGRHCREKDFFEFHIIKARIGRSIRELIGECFIGHKLKDKVTGSERWRLAKGSEIPHLVVVLVALKKFGFELCELIIKVDNSVGDTLDLLGPVTLVAGTKMKKKFAEQSGTISPEHGVSARAEFTEEDELVVG